MIYSASITYDKGKSEATLTRTILRTGSGLVWRLEVEFPPGCAGLVHIRIMDGGYQMFPASPGETFSSDGSVIGFDDLYLKSSEPFEFTIEGWNEDTAWDHNINVRLAMASSEAFMSRYMPSLQWEKFAEIMSQASLQQEYERQRQLAQIQEELGRVE